MGLIDRQKAIEALQERRPVWKDGDDYQYGRASQWTSDIMTIEGVETEDRWIPCSERLPEAGQIVLATNKYGFVWIFKRIENGWSEPVEGWFTDEEEPGLVKAWMPLPKPYEERREEE